MLPDKRPLLIGITGNIGSGKSSVSKQIQAEGYRVVNADECAHQVLYSDDLVASLQKRWGSGIFRDGEIDRQSLAKIVFSSKADLEYLNSMIHPLVLKAFDHIVSISTDDYLFFEVPLLFEANLERCFDFIVLVTSPLDQRIKRVQERDHADDESTLARMANQIDDIDKLNKVDLLINNDSTFDALQKTVRIFLGDLKNIQHRTIINFFTDQQ
ncbi:MAG TPA: dephospho-CoA kinase [Candidatus Cloacimonadota bacterium]|nr:dephospho-CoA kinase [Candidatus Cloacimonadota bacterium]HPS37828.1 dephospho-CoA kinase [Candidatus Cloacimonadota bacterium]